MDESDRATLHEELRRDIALRERKPEGPPYIGQCHNCEAKLAPPMRWCDTDCRKDWEDRQ